jgi:hypothetical protein
MSLNFAGENISMPLPEIELRFLGRPISILVTNEEVSYLKRARLFDLNQLCWHNKIKRYKTKGKSVPLQAWTGPEGSWMLRFQDFKTLGT